MVQRQKRLVAESAVCSCDRSQGVGRSRGVKVREKCAEEEVEMTPSLPGVYIETLGWLFGRRHVEASDLAITCRPY